MRFDIADSGPGIEEGEISQIFERFYRGKSQRHRVPGTGMGLASRRRLSKPTEDSRFETGCHKNVILIAMNGD